MEVRLLNYDGEERIVSIEDNIEVICGIVVSGDMIMIHLKVVDTGEGCRCINFYDGCWSVKAEQLEKFNQIKTVYEALSFKDECNV